ncbi:MAG: hypothetical protein CFH01_00028 [Alphaproteobacteria bacterium MarineAlpha2_Bin1]|nr:MAG: hypothetical protein CFH01_00028 [Alphaproteobacteria bacterium MarineAlpha2_Bin1]
MIKKNKLNQLEDFLIKNDIKPEQIILMKSDASNRRYARIYNQKKSIILMDDQESINLEKFLSIADIFENLGLSVPKIFIKDIEKGFFLLEDFGDETYNNFIQNNSEYDYLYESAVDVLGILQNANIPGDLEIFSENRILKEVSIFLEWTVPYYFGDTKNLILRNNFINNWKEIAKIIHSKSNVITHFDYHIDNLVWLKNRTNHRRVGILDFQDALIGPQVYDLVSLLQDARINVNEKLQKKLKNRYLKSYRGSKDEFNLIYDFVGAQRNTRILGVFARLKLRDNKVGYQKYMNRVWENLIDNLKNPELKNLANSYKYFIPKEVSEFNG